MTKIVIGVDSSTRSEDAIALGGRLARAGDADVLVAVVTPSGRPNRDEAQATAGRMAALLSGRVRTVVVAAPSPAHGLHDLAVAEQAALIVVGSTHTGPLGRVRPGSTGERLLSGAPCAVAVAPYGYGSAPDRPFARVGAAWTGSPESQAAVAGAVAAARAFGAKLEIATVLTNPLTLDSGYAAGYEELANEIRRELDDVVTATCELVPTEGVLLQGQAWRELADRSAELDLLFTGSRGYGPAHAVLTGGTSGPLAQHAHCPVIVLARGVDTPVADLFEPSAARA